MQKENKQETSVGEREILNTRELPWSPEQVFHAWEDPSILAKWWGPDGFTNTFQRFEFKENGKWEFVMHSPAGKDYHNKNKFISIHPTKIVLDHLDPVHLFRVTASFERSGKGTRYSFHMLFDSAEECRKARAFIHDANEQNIDRLEQQLKLSIHWINLQLLKNNYVSSNNRHKQPGNGHHAHFGCSPGTGLGSLGQSCSCKELVGSQWIYQYHS